MVFHRFVSSTPSSICYYLCLFLSIKNYTKISNAMVTGRGVFGDGFGHFLVWDHRRSVQSRNASTTRICWTLKFCEVNTHTQRERDRADPYLSRCLYRWKTVHGPDNVFVCLHLRFRFVLCLYLVF